MTFNEYQKQAGNFASYPTDALIEVDADEAHETTYFLNWLYPALALAEEAGEVSGKLAKFIRKNNYSVEAQNQLRSDVFKELGDVVWQLTALAGEFGFSMEDVARENITKLQDRKQRGVIVGEGDNR